MTSGCLLEWASRIARELSRSALWFDGTCSWVQLQLQPRPRQGKVVATACGPTMYAGTSGIAYFLAEAYAATGERVFSRTALGGLEHALDCAGDVAAGGELGLYDGALGIGFAAFEGGRLLQDEGVVARALRVLDIVRARGVKQQPFPPGAIVSQLPPFALATDTL